MHCSRTRGKVQLAIQDRKGRDSRGDWADCVHSEDPFAAHVQQQKFGQRSKARKVHAVIVGRTHGIAIERAGELQHTEGKALTVSLGFQCATKANEWDRSLEDAHFTASMQRALTVLDVRRNFPGLVTDPFIERDTLNEPRFGVRPPDVKKDEDIDVFSLIHEEEFPWEEEDED